MTAGIITYVGPSLKPNITPDGAGGVFLETYIFDGIDPGVTVRKTWTNLGGMAIFAVVVIGGYHAWTQGIDGNGYPYIQSAGYPVPDWRSWDAGTFNTTLAVFVK